MKTGGKWIGIALMILMMMSVQALAQSGGNGGEDGFGNGECQNIQTRSRMQILIDAMKVEIEGVVEFTNTSGALSGEPLFAPFEL